MPAVAFYVLKVAFCSGILYLYYLLVLKDRLFHSWNRFYLLGTVLISLCFPLIRVPLSSAATLDADEVIKLLNSVSVGNEVVIVARKGIHSFFTREAMILLVYWTISGVILCSLLYGLVRLLQFIRRGTPHYVQGIRLFLTEWKGTPFSFFNNIFWNAKINLESESGQKILKHELSHIEERHSLDKLFVSLVLAPFWCNPFFWLIRRELGLIHEFIADRKAVDDQDTESLANMILQAAYPQYHSALSNHFFSSSIKRRIFMLTKMQNPRVNYISRLLVLPLLTLLFVGFTFNKQAANELEIRNIIKVKPVGPLPMIELASKYPYMINGSINYPVDADSLPHKIKSVDVTKNGEVIVIYEDSRARKMSREEALKSKIALPDEMVVLPPTKLPANVLYVVDGKEMGEYFNVNEIDPNTIESVTVLKDGTAIHKYGEKGRNGVVEIYTKANSSTSEKVVIGKPLKRDIVFEQVEKEAEFPGGDPRWAKFITKVVNEHIDSLQATGETGTCVLQFIVSEEGNLSDVQALTMQGTLFAELMVKAVKNSPAWIPARQNGISVTSIKKQPVTFMIEEE